MNTASASRLKQAYLQHGYVIARSLLATSVLDKTLEVIREVFEHQASRCGVKIGNDSQLDLFSRVATSLFANDRNAYLAAAKLSQYTVSLHLLSLSEEILGVLREIGLELPIVSTRQVIHFMADSLRIEGGYHKTPPHQDWRSVQGSLDGVIVWVPFSDVDRNNYPLEVVPGSHRLGLLPSTEDPFGHRVADGVVEDSSFQPLDVKKGDAVFFSAFMVHRTGNHGGRNVRVAGSFRFNNASEPSYVARNYPIPYIYKPDMRLVTEGFPSQQDIDTVFPAGTAKDARKGS